MSLGYDSGWCFGTWLDYDFPYVGNGKNNPNWRTHIFQRGWNHQPELAWVLLAQNPSRFPIGCFWIMTSIRGSTGWLNGEYRKPYVVPQKLFICFSSNWVVWNSWQSEIFKLDRWEYQWHKKHPNQTVIIHPIGFQCAFYSSYTTVKRNYDDQVLAGDVVAIVRVPPVKRSQKRWCKGYIYMGF